MKTVTRSVAKRLGVLGTSGLMVHALMSQEPLPTPLDGPCERVYGDKVLAAVCRSSEVRSLANSVMARYWRTLPTFGTYAEFTELLKPMLWMRSRFGTCGVKISLDEVAICAKPALVEFADTLARFPAAEEENAQTEQTARQALRKILLRSYDDLQGCQATAAKNLDDGISPAGDIATAVAKTCFSKLH